MPGNGHCMSMAQASQYYNYDANKELVSYAYNSTWDSHLIYGCVCTRAPSVDNHYQDRGHGFFDNYPDGGMSVPPDSFFLELNPDGKCVCMYIYIFAYVY